MLLCVKGIYPATQIVPVPGAVKKIPGRKSNAVNEVVFRAVNVPPLGFSAYAVAKKKNVVQQPQLDKFISNKVNINH